MSANLTAGSLPRSDARDDPRACPERPPTGPVLLGDCATTADHTTLLLALWQRWDRPPED